MPILPTQQEHWLNNTQVCSCSPEPGHVLWLILSEGCSALEKPHLRSIWWAWRVALFTWCAFTNAHCSHLWALQKACRALHTTLVPSCVSHARRDLSHIYKNKTTSWLHRYCLARNICAHACICRVYCTCVCVSLSGWVINEHGWMASAGRDSTTARKSFLLSLCGLLIQSSKEVRSDCWNRILRLQL